MADKLWFGHARGHMQFVPCPLIDSSVTRNRYVESMRFENGGGDGRRSNQYQMQYDFAFSGLAHELDGIDAFNKYAQGFYGDDLIYLAHPANFETNMFPAGWASPSLSEKGWGKISSDAVVYSNADGPSVTNLVTNPSMEAVTAGTDSTKRTNLVTNPSFETDTAGWSASFGTGGAGTAARVAGGYIGGYEYRMTWTTASTAGYSNVSGQSIAVTVGTTYTYSAWVKVSTARLVQATINWFNSGSTYISTSYSTDVSVPANTWTRISVTATAPANAAFLQPNNISATNYAIGATFALDAALVEAASGARSYFDGTYAEDPTLIEAWTGTVNNSTSTALVRSVSNRENLVTNPSFEVDTAGWLNISPSTIVRDTAEKYVGSASLKVTTGTAVGQGAIWASSGSILTAGVTYTASMWVKGPIGHIVYGLFRPSIGGDIASADIALTGDWQRISITHTNASGTAQIMVRQRTAAAATFYIDAMLLEQSTTVNPYFDGSYTDMPGWATSWAGTANASRSVATAAPVTVRTNLVTNPSMESVTAGSVVMRRNLVLNPSVEADLTNILTAAGPGGTNTLTRVTSGGLFGSAFARATWTVGTTSASGNLENNPASVTVFGATYTGSVYVRVNSAQRLVLQATGTSVGTSIVNPVDVPANTWTRLSYTHANVTTAGTLNIRIAVSGGRNWVAGDTLDADGWLLEASSVVGDFFDGSTTDALGWDYAWSGTANASISTAACAATTVRTNLTPYPSFEGNNTTGWGSAGANIAYLAASTDTAYTGTFSCKTTWGTSGAGLVESQTGNLFAVTAGNVYSAGIYIKQTAGTARNVTVGVQWLTAASGYISQTNGTAVLSVVNGWVRATVQGVTAPANAALVRFQIQFGTVSSTDVFYFDSVLSEQAATLGDFFDGSFTPAGDFSYGWTGTANASTSIQRGASVATVVAGWAGVNYADIQTNTDFKYGSKSWKSICTSPQTFLRGVPVPLTSGTTYTFSAWVKPSITRTFRIGIQASAGISSGSFVSCPAGQWTQISLTGAPTSTGTFNVYVNSETVAAVGDSYLIDGLLVEASPIVQDYFDGSVVSADADLTNSWSGTAHASTSLMRGVGVASIQAPPVHISYFQSSVWSKSGTKSLRIRPVLATSNTVDILDINTVAGQTRTVIATVRVSSPLLGTGVSMSIGVRTYGGATAQHQVSVPNIAGEYEVRLTFTASSGTTSTFLRFWFAGTGIDGNVWIDNLAVIDGTYTSEYFDGNSTDSGNITYAWTGTANASTSTMLSEMVLYGNPPRATTYTVTNINQPPTKVCTLVIPPEYTLYLGASGTSTGSAGVFIRPIQASDSLYYGPTEELTLLDPNGSVRMNKTLNGATYQAVEIFLMKTDAAAATVTLNSMMAQLYKTGTTPALPTNHYQGEGSTGLMFADDAIVETYQYMHPPRKGISTKLIEVEAWR